MRLSIFETPLTVMFARGTHSSRREGDVVGVGGVIIVFLKAASKQTPADGFVPEFRTRVRDVCADDDRVPVRDREGIGGDFGLVIAYSNVISGNGAV